MKAVREDYDAAQAALKYFEREWPRLQQEPLTRGLGLRQVRRSLSQSEATYIIRLYATFEGILRAYLADVRKAGRPIRTPAEALINRVASRLHILDKTRDDAHTVRLYRNSLVHADGGEVEAVSFQQALSFLNQYLVWVPNPT